MPLPQTIPTGARLMVRTLDGMNTATGRQEFRDYIGHVISWDGVTLQIERDAAANGSRPVQRVSIDVHDIVVIKPIPERHMPKTLIEGKQKLTTSGLRLHSQTAN